MGPRYITQGDLGMSTLNPAIDLGSLLGGDAKGSALQTEQISS